MNKFDPLNLYVNYILTSSFLNFHPPLSNITVGKMGIENGDFLLGIILDRQGQFQTEMFIVPPHIKKIEGHIHPDVDSYELALGGDFIFENNGIRTEFKPNGLSIKDSSVLTYVPHNFNH